MKKIKILIIFTLISIFFSFCNQDDINESRLTPNNPNLVTEEVALSISKDLNHGWYAFNNFNPDDYTFNYQVAMVYNIKP